MKGKLVLASGSPRRRELLCSLGLEFIVDPAQIEETRPAQGATPAEYAEQLAIQKTNVVAHRHEDSIVLGADTVVVLDGCILGKPPNLNTAVQMLQRLAGNVHEVITGFALIDTRTGQCRAGHEVTRVQIRGLDDDVIRAYVKTGEPLDKAGSYAIQGLGSALVERIEGCFYNVVGLPIPRLITELTEFGICLGEIWRGLDRRVQPGVRSQ